MTKFDLSNSEGNEVGSDAPYADLHNPRVDDIDIMSEFYPAFGVMFTEDEVDNIHTVGDAFDAIFIRMNDLGHGDKCRYAMLFFRLRAYFRYKYSCTKFSLYTKVDTLSDDHVGHLLEDLHKKTGIIAPLSGSKHAGLIVSILFGGFFIFIYGMANSYYAISLLGASSFFAGLIGFQSIGSSWEEPNMTIREMIVKIEPLNYHLLTVSGGRHDRATLWNALIHVLAQRRDLTPNRISLDTRLIRSE